MTSICQGKKRDSDRNPLINLKSDYRVEFSHPGILRVAIPAGRDQY
ncbi:hypothetical protein FB99_38420 (plasmid) [Pantoea agglomerans]|nr:hypothetical protein FB99_38420 [Pantoea agglomerans]